MGRNFRREETMTATARTERMLLHWKTSAAAAFNAIAADFAMLLPQPFLCIHGRGALRVGL